MGSENAPEQPADCPESGGNRRGIARPFKAWLIRVAFSLAVLEAGLQIAGGILGVLYAPENSRRKSDGPDMVLCAGDSFTAGMGAPADRSYPRQLEALLRRRNPGREFQVMNVGRRGTNSSWVLASLDTWNARYHPDALLVLTGLNNAWNVKGRRAPEDISLLGAIDGALSYLKTYQIARWLAHLATDGADAEPPPPAPANDPDERRFEKSALAPMPGAWIPALAPDFLAASVPCAGDAGDGGVGDWGDRIAGNESRDPRDQKRAGNTHGARASSAFPWEPVKRAPLSASPFSRARASFWAMDAGAFGEPAFFPTTTLLFFPTTRVFFSPGNQEEGRPDESADRGDNPGGASSEKREPNPDTASADVLSAWGHRLLLGGFPAKAEPWFRRALAREPDHRGAGEGLGSALFRTARYAQARDAWRAVVARAPGNAGVWTGLAECEARIGPENTRAARKQRVLERGYEQAEDDWGLCMLLGESYIAARRWNDAERIYRRARLMDPTRWESAVRHADALRRLGRVSDAIDVLEAQARAHPENADVFKNIGALNADMGKFEPAERAYARAVELEPEDADSWFQLGNARAQLGRRRDARQALLEGLWRSRDIEFFCNKWRLVVPGGRREFIASLRGLLPEMERRLGKRWVQRRVRPYLETTSDRSSTEKWLERDLVDIARWCRARGVALILQTYPGPEMARAIRGAAARSGAVLVDHAARFERGRREGEFRRADVLIPDGHPNARGYAILAGELAPAVERALAWDRPRD